MSWMTEAWRIFRVTPRPVSRRDIADRTGMSETEASNCICRLKKAECITFAYGSARTGRYYSPVPGKAPPQDRRGKTDKARAQRSRLYARRRASRPVSQFTAGRLKP